MKIFSFISPKEHYKNKEAFLWCPDQRFRDLREALEKANGIELADPIIIPGGAKVLVTPKDPRDREFILEQIELLKKGHGFEKLYVMAHNECAACEGNTDRSFYEKMLKSAREVIQKRISDLKVVLLYADFDGLYEVE